MTSTFAETLAATANATPGPPCSVGRWRAGLADQDRIEFDRAIGDASMTTARIATAMRALGFDSNAYTVGRHRKQDCKCNVV